MVAFELTNEKASNSSALPTRSVMVRTHMVALLFASTLVTLHGQLVRSVSTLFVMDRNYDRLKTNQAKQALEAITQPSEEQEVLEKATCRCFLSR